MGAHVDPVLYVRFDEALATGISFAAAARAAGVSLTAAKDRWKKIGGMPMQKGRRGGLPRPPEPDPVELPPVPFEKVEGRLTYFERCVIQVRLHEGHPQRRIAAELQRSPSVICREIGRNRGQDGVYDARRADRLAAGRRRRDREPKLAERPELAAAIEEYLEQGWSPKLISEVLKKDHPDDRNMQVSHETVYKALYVQGRGALRQDLRRCLSLKHRARVPQGRATNRGRPYREALRISQRPPSVEDRAVPGHWEGDLIIGGDGRSAIGTLVERSTRFVILLHLPGGRHTADAVAEAMINAMGELPSHLRRSITWDRGTEMADYSRIMLELEAPVYFADPHSPWQRGSNENTNRLLRFWFEKGADLSVHTAEDLRRAQDMLNRRPRPTLGLRTPAQALTELLLPTAA
ncbi:IS30 family transposase [Sinomonas sp. G460-2]|uniref:IS30 family transposase n=1 Tax=Sinomonas sp. G460-2 TaxID=3393464 RepID=UPI0039EEF448